MSVEALMTETVTLLLTSGENRDSIGGSTPTDSSTSSDAYLEPQSGDESMAERNTQLGLWLAILPATTPLDGWDRVQYGSDVFDVVAPPRPMFNARLGSVSHVEVDLRLVT